MAEMTVGSLAIQKEMLMAAKLVAWMVVRMVEMKAVN